MKNLRYLVINLVSFIINKRFTPFNNIGSKHLKNSDLIQSLFAEFIRRAYS